MFLIQAALVVAGVVLFSFFDPLNIFNSRKLTMKDTPTVLEQFRQIGELITAEYYGEVLASSVEIENTQKKDMRKSLHKQLKKFEGEFVGAVKRAEDFRRDGKFYREFKDKNPELVDDDLYVLLAEYWEKMGFSEKEMILEYKTKSTLIDTALLTNFLTAKYPPTEVNRKVRKSNLVLLGRGYVKAGIDLSNIGEHSLRYIESKKIIQLTMHQPEILRTSINPWFIPQKKIPGFEFLYIGSRVEGDKAIKTSMKVKQECLDKLMEDAMKANILGQAKTNAEQSLSNLFSLLLDDRITVQIFSHPLVAYGEEIRQEVRQQLSTKETIPLPERRLPYTLADSLVNQYSKSHLFETLVFLDSTYRWFAPTDIRRSFRDKNIDSVFYLSLEIKGLYHDFQKDGILTRLEKETFERKIATDIPNRRDSLYWIFSNLNKKNTGIRFENFVMDTTTVKGLSVNLAAKGMLPSAVRGDLKTLKCSLWNAYLTKLTDSTKPRIEDAASPASTSSTPVAPARK